MAAASSGPVTGPESPPPNGVTRVPVDEVREATKVVNDMAGIIKEALNVIH
ncbi:MAG: hypothetical protein ACRC35_02935 [Angustibacter sp.]